jgi:hypothetical protein
MKSQLYSKKLHKLRSLESSNSTRPPTISTAPFEIHNGSDNSHLPETGRLDQYPEEIFSGQVKSTFPDIRLARIQM